MFISPHLFGNGDHLKVSFDLDGTLYHVPFFQYLFTLLKREGHTVGILTGHAVYYRDKDLLRLEKLGIVPDFYYHTERGGSEEENAAFKKKTIIDQKIHHHFDDFDHFM